MTAYLTLFLVIIYYLTGSLEAEFLNVIDHTIVAKLSLAKSWASFERLEKTLRRVILMFSDQQAVTGIALLASGYAQLNSGLDSYHWQILVYLAWHSSLTHLTTLTVLRQYFRDNHHARSWRVMVMLITVSLLGGALLPTGDERWFFNYLWYRGYSIILPATTPAICFFRDRGSPAYIESDSDVNIPMASMMISIIVLASGFLTRVIKLSEHATMFSRIWLEHKPSKVLRRARDLAVQQSERQVLLPQKMAWTMIYITLEVTYVWCKAVFNVYTSMI